MIQLLKTALDRAEKRIEHLEGNNDQLANQNHRLTQLTYLLMAPERKPSAETSEQPKHREAYTPTPDNDDWPTEDTPEPHEKTAEPQAAYEEPSSESNEHHFAL